jgi:hypothetical protein
LLDTPVPLKPGRVRVRLDPAEQSDEEEDVFRAMVEHSWRESLDDPAEDVYSMSDGWPIDPTTGEVADETR